MLTEYYYDLYSNNKKSVWKKRLTWNGLYGDAPQNAINIIKYLKESKTDFLVKLSETRNVKDLRKIVEKESIQYVKWSLSIEPHYSDVEQVKIKDFFIGAIGEVFFICLLSTIGNLRIGNKAVYFNKVAPLTLDNDNGVDGTCIYSVDDKEVSCALQIKFWNPYIDNQITMQIAQGVHSEALNIDAIDNNENKNIIICWLGTDKNVSRYLKSNEKLWQRLIFIDMNTLDRNINDQVPFFWREKLPDFLESLV